MRSRLTEFVTFLKFRRFLEVIHFYRCVKLQFIVMVMLLMLVTAVTVVTMLLAMLEAMLEGAKSAQGHSAVYCASLGGVGIMLLLPEKPWICSLGFRENIHFENGLLIMQVD